MGKGSAKLFLSLPNLDNLSGARASMASNVELTEFNITIWDLCAEEIGQKGVMKGQKGELGSYCSRLKGNKSSARAGTTSLQRKRQQKAVSYD